MSFAQGGFEWLESRVLFSTGQVDPAFNSGTLLKGDDRGSIAEVAALPDGGILAAGAMLDSQLYLAKYRFDGTLDPSFGAGGKIIATPRGMQHTDRLALLPDGSFLIAGTRSLGGGKTAWGMVKFTSAGKVDTTFASNGLLKLTDLNYINNFALDAQQRIVVVAIVPNSNGPAQQQGVVRRYAVDGKLDSTFHGGHDVIFNAAAGTSEGDYNELNLRSVIVDPQGRILVGTDNTHFDAHQSIVGSSASITRLDENGKVDRAFGTRGHINPIDTADEITPISNGQLVVSGLRHLYRLNSDGSIDATYGSAGYVDTAEVAQIGRAAAAVEPDGAVFRCYTGGNSVTEQFFSVQKFDAKGKLDSDFGDAGTIMLDEGESTHARSAAFAADGSLLIGGETGDIKPDNTVSFALARVLIGEGPAVQLIPKTLKHDSQYLSMSVLIRDADGVDLSTLDNSDLNLFDSGGNTRKIRFLSSQDLNGDGKYIRATYRTSGANVANWSSAANGTYEVRLQRKQIADKDGNSAAAQVLGTVRVKIT